MADLTSMMAEISPNDGGSGSLYDAGSYYDAGDGYYDGGGGGSRRSALAEVRFEVSS
jgi:hypothetical protein